MENLARLITNRSVAWLIVVVTLGLAGGSLLLARQVEHEDDLLAFLPRDNPEVRVFHEINKRFGGLDVALVGIQADDVFSRGFLESLQRVTRELSETKGLDHVLSLTNIVDFTPDPQKGGVTTDRLVHHLPTSAAEQAALRVRVMSRDHVVGNLISRGGDAVLIYCYLAYGTDPKAMAARIQHTVRRGLPGHRIFWGGGPFISTYIYNITQRDMQRLTPWAVVAIVLIMLLAFRDLVGTFLALLSTGIGIVIALGLMGLTGVRFNIVLSSMPVILFAIGSAYGIHVLARFYRLRQEVGSECGDPSGVAMARTLKSVGPTVVAAGLTTAAGLLSFIMMDIRPIRTFGLFTALGILFTLMLSLTFIPAVACVVGLRRRQTRSLVLRRAVVRLSVFAASHRWAVGGVLLLLAAAGAVWTTRVDSRMDHATFFSAGSPPDRAERFLREHFGGSQFIQLHVTGDMNDPDVLREVRRLADRIGLMPNVSSVMHLGRAVAQVNEVMVGQRRIPDTEQQVRLLYAFLAGDPSVAQLVSSDRSHALLHIKVSSNLAADLEPLLARIERLIANGAMKGYRVRPLARATASGPARARLLDGVALRVEAAAHGLLPQPLSAGQRSALRRALERPLAEAPRAQVQRELARFLGSEECAVTLPKPTQPTEASGEPAPGAETRVAAALAALGPRPVAAAVEQAVAKALGRATDDDLVQDLALSVEGPLDDTWRRGRARLAGERLLRVAGVTVPAGGKGKRLRRAVTEALLDLDLQRALVPAVASKSDGARAAAAGDAAGGSVSGTMTYQVNGLPVMHRGLSRSVERNQIRSLGFALALIVLIMALLFRSLTTGLLVAAPTVMTLLLIYGGMGLIGVRLDIGTSMLASLILGAGVDYAVHLVAAWYAPEDAPLVSAAARAADRTGPAIWTNAVMVCAGFLVLATGEARPLQNVGGLTGAAMLSAAVVTFLLVPVLARRRRYSRSVATLEETADSEAVAAVLAERTPRERPT